jgi:hypothetical protein
MILPLGNAGYSGDKRKHQEGESKMNLSAPTLPVFLIAVALFLLALLGHFAVIPAIAVYKFWLAIGAFVVLALGNLLKGM